MTLQELIEVWKTGRDKEDRERGYNPNTNYCGSGLFMLPRWFFFHWAYNRASFYHDNDYQVEDRTTQSNYRMAARICIDLMIAGVMPWNFKFWLAMGIFWGFLFPAVSTVGRLIDKLGGK